MEFLKTEWGNLPQRTQWAQRGFTAENAKSADGELENSQGTKLPFSALSAQSTMKTIKKRERPNFYFFAPFASFAVSCCY